MGFTPGSGSSSSHAKTNGLITPAKRGASSSAAKKNVLKGKIRQRENMPNNDSRLVVCFSDVRSVTESSSDDSVMPVDSVEEESAAETEHEKTSPTPARSTKRQKVIGGRVTKRISPRKSTKTNYKELEDPFVNMNNIKDENGENVFGEPSGTESEDTYVTDGSFKETGDEAVVKMEEEAV